MALTETLPGIVEAVRYPDPAVPLYVTMDSLSDYPGMRSTCHWHEDIEFLYVLKGEMCYSVAGDTIPLKEKDCIFVNSRQIHYDYTSDGEDCTFLVAVINPKILIASSKLYEDFVVPFLKGDSLLWLRFCPGDPDYDAVSGTMKEIWKLHTAREEAYQLEVIHMLAGLFLRILRSHPCGEGSGTAEDPALELQKKMVAFLTENYRRELSLEEIGESVAVSRSTCCRIFRKYLKQSPLAFLNAYRLQASCGMLITSDRTVTEIASLCGFNSSSYYSRLFTRNYGCTPLEYRQKSRK